MLSCGSRVGSEDEDLLTRQMHIVLLTGDSLNMLAVVTDIAEASAVFIFTFLLGNNSLFHYVKNQRRKAFIQEEYNRYLPQYEADSARLSDIRDNREHIERIAREQYYMHLPGEEVFVLAPDTTTAAQH